jgi:hypothetical protein
VFLIPCEREAFAFSSFNTGDSENYPCDRKLEDTKQEQPVSQPAMTVEVVDGHTTCVGISVGKRTTLEESVRTKLYVYTLAHRFFSALKPQ